MEQQSVWAVTFQAVGVLTRIEDCPDIFPSARCWEFCIFVNKHWTCLIAIVLFSDLLGEVISYDGTLP